jgi:hypothetical protein
VFVNPALFCPENAQLAYITNVDLLFFSALSKKMQGFTNTAIEKRTKTGFISYIYIFSDDIIKKMLDDNKYQPSPFN